MNVGQAVEHASAFFIPEFVFAGGEEAIQAERAKNEEAIQVLVREWMGSERPGFSFDLVRELADRNREMCDQLDQTRLSYRNGLNLSRALSDDDTCRAIAALQGRDAEDIAREVASNMGSFSIVYASCPARTTVLGVDIETTSREPDRGYIINIGWAVMNLDRSDKPRDGQTRFFGIPDIYREQGVPLSNIHKIEWPDIEGKTPFRQDKELQVKLLDLMTLYPYMAHNAAFEDSWFMLNLDGYAEARKEGRIVVIDSRDICRKLDAEVASAMQSSNPASLENWALRRGTLKPGETERHLGLADVELMLETVRAELELKNLLM